MNEILTVMIRTIASFSFLTWNDKCEIQTWDDIGLRFLFFLTFNSVIEICYFIPVHNLFNVLYKGTRTVTDVFSLFYSKVVNKKTIFIIQPPLPLRRSRGLLCCSGRRFCGNAGAGGAAGMDPACPAW